jgi:Ca2+-binding EF-hand superfamily protein
MQSGYIDSGELTAVLRGMGFNPTEKRISEILDAYDSDGNGNLSFGEFVEVSFSLSHLCFMLGSVSLKASRAHCAFQLWAYYCHEAQSERELISRAFTFFLPDDCQTMSYSDFREVMTETGDPLSLEEVV